MENSTYTMDWINIGLTVIFILLNGFFVAAEFALVKLSRSKLKVMIRENRPFAATAMWLFNRQNLALSACQLGITMASLALGWIGEPAIAHLITPYIHELGINSQAVIHGVAFGIAFSIITSLHIVIGEQVPKIYAIRKPGKVFLGSAGLLKGFYVILYPFMYVLNSVSNLILKWMGIDASGEHETLLTEEEIRASLSIAYSKGELTKVEHRLLNAVFRFDDQVARRIMKPRNEVEFLDINRSFRDHIEFIKKSVHSRFPLCDGSLDKLFGVIHIKDITGYDSDDNLDLKSIARPVMLVPENILIGSLMQEFRSNRQHFAFVQSEHGTVLGIVTMEDVLEELVGNIQDEFDLEEPKMTEQSEGRYLVSGDMLVDDLNQTLGLDLTTDEADTISGLIVERFGHKIETGKKFRIEDTAELELVETDGIRATKVLVTLLQKEQEES